MNTLIAATIALVLALSAHTASAYIAIVGTTIPMADAAKADGPALEQVLYAAIRDVLDHAVAFTPTVVRIQDAKVVGDRLYLFLLLSDEAAPESAPSAPERAPSGGDQPAPGKQPETSAAGDGEWL